MSRNLSLGLVKLRDAHGDRWYETATWKGYVDRLATGESENLVALYTLGVKFQYSAGALRRPFMPLAMQARHKVGYRFHDEQPTLEEQAALREANRVIPRLRGYWEVQDAAADTNAREAEHEVSQLDRIEAKLDRLLNQRA